MSTTLSIRIDKDLDQALSQLAAEQKRSRSDLVREMLHRQIAVVALQLLREKLVPQAERAGYLTDDDFFRDFS